MEWKQKKSWTQSKPSWYISPSLTIHLSGIRHDGIKDNTRHQNPQDTSTCNERNTQSSHWTLSPNKQNQGEFFQEQLQLLISSFFFQFVFCIMSLFRSTLRHCFQLPLGFLIRSKPLEFRRRWISPL